MKLLIGHMASADAFPRMVQARRWQKAVLGFPAGLDEVIVTDKAENTVDGLPTIVYPTPEDGLYNLSAMRNRLVDYAKQGDYYGLIIIEADFIVLRWFSVFPATWAVPYAVYDQPDRLTFPDLPAPSPLSSQVIKEWQILGWRSLIPVHCVMLNASVFDRLRWDEAYHGNGYDDWDFNNIACASVGLPEHTDFLLCHRYHPTMMGQPRPENRARYESRWGKIPA